MENPFCRKAIPTPLPFRIEGIGMAPITPVADASELAAQVLLDAGANNPGRNGFMAKLRHIRKAAPEKGSPAYYAVLSSRVRDTRAIEARLAMRYVAYCEQELAGSARHRTQNTKLTELERGLYDRIDTIEREGGELKHRWQRCLARVTVQLLGVGSDARQVVEVGTLSKPTTHA